MNYYHTHVHSRPDALIFCLHGLNSHGGSTSYLATRIVESTPNVNVYAVDFLNFGNSDGGYKGYIPSF
jgi:pimeloyl-ACP methyl ester carboxylesterase